MEQQFIEALYGKDWYVVAALVVFGVILFVKKSPLAPMLWDRIPGSLKWLGPFLLGAATGFVDGFQQGVGWEQALLRALAGAVFIGGPAMGLHSALKGARKKPTSSLPPE